MTPARHRRHLLQCAPAHAPAVRAATSNTRLNGVSATLRNRVKPPAAVTSRMRAGPACVPSARPTSCESDDGRAQQRREAVVHPPDRVEVVFDVVAGHRLDDHPGAVVGDDLAHVACRADRVAHVVQAVEHRHEVVALAAELLRRTRPRTERGRRPRPPRHVRAPSRSTRRGSPTPRTSSSGTPARAGSSMRRARSRRRRRARRRGASAARRRARESTSRARLAW